MYGRNENGAIKLGLPPSGILKDGRTVSNYNEMPVDILLSEDWKAVEEVKPTYDDATQMLVIDTTEEQTDKIIATYKAVSIPADELSELENLLLQEMGL